MPRSSHADVSIAVASPASSDRAHGGCSCCATFAPGPLRAPLVLCSSASSAPPRRATNATLRGWIVVQDGYAGGSLVLVHELSHFANRFVVWQRHREAVDVFPGHGSWEPSTVAMVRARLLDEIAARHVAYLAETGLDPEDSATRWPAPGALFACAVKIASYPEIYADPGYIPGILASEGRDALRDLVGTWFAGLEGFHFFEAGTRRAEIHAAWLAEEARVAAMGSEAPEVVPEGTL